MKQAEYANMARNDQQKAVRIDPRLHNRIKVVAAMEGTSFYMALQNIILATLDERENALGIQGNGD